MANLLNELAEVSKYLTEEARDQRLSDIVEDAMEELATGASDKEKWIPVSERLPEYTENCLVWVGVNPLGTEMWMEQRTALFHVPAQRFYVHKSCKEELIGEVVKWMPLPQPPMDGDEE